jgi:hypothetical protein
MIKSYSRFYLLKIQSTIKIIAFAIILLGVAKVIFLYAQH